MMSFIQQEPPPEVHTRLILGFTLLELIIAISLISILATMAAPSFSQIVEANKVKRLATEIEWLFVQAKSESVMRNEFVLIDINNMSQGIPSINNWTISANVSGGEQLASINGADFNQISIVKNFNGNNLKFNPFNGKLNKQISFNFFAQSNKQIKLVVSGALTNRIYTCSDQSGVQKVYGYDVCS